MQQAPLRTPLHPPAGPRTASAVREPGAGEVHRQPGRSISPYQAVDSLGLAQLPGRGAKPGGEDRHRPASGARGRPRLTRHAPGGSGRRLRDATALVLPAGPGTNWRQGDQPKPSSALSPAPPGNACGSTRWRRSASRRPCSYASPRLRRRSSKIMKIRCRARATWRSISRAAASARAWRRAR